MSHASLSPPTLQDSQPSSSSKSAELRALTEPMIGSQLQISRCQRKFELVIFLSAFSVVVVTGGTASLLVGWLSAFHDPIESGGSFLSALQNGTFAIKEPSRSDSLHSTTTNTETLRILMFSALASHVVSVAGTILVTLFAYRTASQWLNASEVPDSANLTPIQYGLLVRTLGSGSLMSISNALRYTKRSKRASLPRFFKEAIVVVTVIYTLNHVIGLIDLWLHKTARSISLVRPTPIQVTNAPYGLVFSEDVCGPLDHRQLPCQKLVTLYLDGLLRWGYSEQRVYSQAFDTLFDLNPYSALQHTPDGMSFLVPGPVKNFKSYGFTFHTYGLQVECANLADRCNTLSPPPTESISSGFPPITNCSKAGYPLFPWYWSGSVLPSGEDTRDIRPLIHGVIDGQMGGMINGTGDFKSPWTPNPATTLIQLRWPNTTVRGDVDSPGVVYTNALDMYATCEMSYYDLSVQYDSAAATWNVIKASLADPDLAAVFWSPLLFDHGLDAIQDTLKPYATSLGAETFQVLGSTLAKINMAFVEPLTKATEATNVTSLKLITLGLYPTGPTLLLIGCLYSYSVIAVVILVMSCTSRDRTIVVPRQLTRGGKQGEERSALTIAQTWLTDPLPLIGSMFPGGDGRHVMRSVESNPLRKVYDSDWELGKVGIGLYERRDGEMIFGLMRQVPSQSRRYGRFFSDGEGVTQPELLMHKRGIYSFAGT